MKSTGRISILLTMPAWATSLLTAVFSLFLVFIFAGIVALIGSLLGLSGSETGTNVMAGNFLAHLFTGFCVAIMCYYICKAHPKSVWYTPVICNAVTLWAGLGNYFIEGNPFYMFILPFGIGWILSVVASVRGAKRALREGKKKQRTLKEFE